VLLLLLLVLLLLLLLLLPGAAGILGPRPSQKKDLLKAKIWGAIAFRRAL
jgi:hypothetical protein